MIPRRSVGGNGERGRLAVDVERDRDVRSVRRKGPSTFIGGRRPGPVTVIAPSRSASTPVMMPLTATSRVNARPSVHCAPISSGSKSTVPPRRATLSPRTKKLCWTLSITVQAATVARRRCARTRGAVVCGRRGAVDAGGEAARDPPATRRLSAQDVSPTPVEDEPLTISGPQSDQNWGSWPAAVMLT